MRRTSLVLPAALGMLAILVAVASPLAVSRPASALVPVHAAPPAGLSVKVEDAPGDRGFEFEFKSDTSTTRMTIDPLGFRHNASASVSSKAGSISLDGRYVTSDREIVIRARRGGQEIGEFTWRVEAVLR